MLTSPVNVAIVPGNGVALKANTATSDHSARRDQQPAPSHHVVPAETVIEPELPSNSLLTHVNAVAATAGNRTILQELGLNVAAMLRIARRPDENLTALFLRIIAKIEAMPQSERLQFEIRAGLKPLRITLSDLVMALRKPDGQEAARLTATAEAPAAVPGRTAASAATTTYLEEGTDSGHTEETLAMRAAARNSAAGQSVFSAESKIRPTEPQPGDSKVFQSQLKTIFEPGDTKGADIKDEAPARGATGGMNLSGATEPVDAGDTNAPAVLPEADSAEPLPTPRVSARSVLPESGSAEPTHPTPRASGNAGENVAISSANLKLDPPTVEKIRNAAQAIANQASETLPRTEQEHPAAEKADDRRLQTMLTLKGLAEVVTAIPAKAAELLAIVVAEATAPLPETADGSARVPAETPPESLDDGQTLELGAAPQDVASENVMEMAASDEMPAEIQREAGMLSAEGPEAQAEATAAEEHQATNAERPPLARPDLARPDLTQHAVPFAYAQAQPARDEMVEAAEEEETREDTDEDGQGEGAEGDEPDRPRDEYDAIHDPLPEEDAGVVITRDSSEADRAFALYQRMGGF